MLPIELLQNVFYQAAISDPKTAHRLAKVSHQACECSKVARWTHLTITSMDGLRELMKLLHHLRSSSAITPLSLPGIEPSFFTRSLSIHTETTSMDLITYLSELSDSDRKEMIHEHDFLSLFPNLDALNLGSAEFQAFSPSIQQISPTSLRLVYNGNETLLRSVFTPYPNANAARGAFTVPSSWKVKAPGLRRRLRYLHIIGIDPQSELTGLPFPMDVLEPLCVGSTSMGSFLHAYLVQNANMDIETSTDDSDPEWTPGVTYLRYDTRKFSYRPTDILASRLRPFFQQLNIGDEEDDLMTQIGASRLLQLDLRWLSSGPTLNTMEDEQRKKLNSAMFSGGWPRELRGAWTDRSMTHNSPYESFRYELSESIQSLYGWDPPSLGASQILTTEGAYVERIENGFSAKDRQVMDSAQSYISDVKLVRSGQYAMEPVSFRMRYPASFLHLGEAPVAFSDR
ncbi:hypothetical protein MPSI1_003644 [Malassezia psittaci]|uniref:Uncharacterized protein n=1 Tax=Malassezia psittaci TaxID=1821823 RepID=A0AAF0JG08_9BASI|nr:hypothetical protein MPSI1_003644 [Malassezia psittaci]